MPAAGTGGHVFTGLAIAEKLFRSKAKVSWLAAGGDEMRFLRAHDLPVFVVPFSRGRGVWLRLFVAVIRAIILLRRIRPQAVLCMGGYAGVPGALAAKCLGVPLLLHEQNAVPGRANRLLKKIAKRVLCGFPDGFGEWVGNPVRQGFFECPPPAARYGARCGALRILVLGGSQGAAALNRIAPVALALLSTRPIVVHQCGFGNLLEVRESYQKNGVEVSLHEFINDVVAEMAAADLVISRAGASTLAELSALGVAALLIPYPYAANRHQWFNAGAMKKQGAAECWEEDMLDAEKLAEYLRDMTRDNCLTMAQQSHLLAKPKAAALSAMHCMTESGYAT